MEKKPAILFGTATAPPEKSDQPKIVAAGKPRRRIPCTPAQLQALDDSAPPEVVAQAVRAVNGVNLDDHYFDDVVRFGAELQAEHGRLAQAELDMVSGDALASPRATYLELVERLEKLNPERVFAVGPLKRLRTVLQGGVTERSFARDYAAIKALSQALDDAMPVVNGYVDTLNRLAPRYAALATSLEAHVLACRFILGHIDASIRDDGDLSAHYQSQREALANREVSLCATGATLVTGRQTLKLIANGMSEFGLSGKNFTQEDLPAWYAAFSAALLARRMKSPDSGVFAAVVAAHRHLLSKLKRREAP